MMEQYKFWFVEQNGKTSEMVLADFTDRRERLNFERYAIEARYFDCTARFLEFGELTPDEQWAVFERIREIDAEMGDEPRGIGFLPASDMPAARAELDPAA
jgi:hypothetical protein